MTDPLSITTGILGLSKVIWNVGVELKQFRDNAATVNTTVNGLLHDVESLGLVLDSMKTTFEEENLRHATLHATGHIGNHWRNIGRSLQDGQDTLKQLEGLIQNINKSVTMLDGPRKQLRLQNAEEQVANYRHQIQSYRDALQLSLQTMILWNQFTIQESTEKILPNLAELHQDIRRISSSLNSRIQGLQEVVMDSNKNNQIGIMSNLRDCVRSAATIVSSASTYLATEEQDRDDTSSTAYGSDFGDCFPSDQANDSMLQWISSNSTYHEENHAPPGELGSTNINYDSDSDSDLEVEFAKALFNSGKEKLVGKDFQAAERLFRNCISRMSTSARAGGVLQLTSTASVSRMEVLDLLFETYSQRQMWEQAQSVLKDKLSIEQQHQNSTGDRQDHAVLSDVLKLSEVLFYKGEYVEGHLYARRALKGYRKLGLEGAEGAEKTLLLLVKICKADDKVEEEDACLALLAEILNKKAQSESTTSRDQIRDEEEKQRLADDPKLLPGKRSSSPSSLFSFEIPWTDPEAASKNTSDEISNPIMQPIIPPPREEQPDPPAQTPGVSELRDDQHQQNILDTTPNKSGSSTKLGSIYSTFDEIITRQKILTDLKNLPIPPRIRTPRELVGTTAEPKISCIGDSATGKTLILKQTWEENSPLTCYASYKRRFEIDGINCIATLEESPPHTGWEFLRYSSYIGSQVVLLVFGINQPWTLENISYQWAPEIARRLPGIPYILVGNKVDLRYNQETVAELEKTGEHPITVRQGLDSCKEIGAIAYFECSAKTGEGTQDVLEYALRLALLPEKHRNNSYKNRLLKTQFLQFFNRSK